MPSIDQTARLHLSLAVLWLAACGPSSDREVPAVATTASPTAPVAADPGSGRFLFVDAAVEAGISGFQQINGAASKPYIVDAVGGGVAFLDYDLDGDLDLYLTNGSTLAGFSPGDEPTDALYRNDGARFTDVSAQAAIGDTGWTNGISVADIDNDGWPDLYLTNFLHNVLYRNNGDGTFSDWTTRAGLQDERWSTGATFFDADADGDLDLYLANYVEFDPDFKPSNPALCTWRDLMVFYGPKGLRSAADAYYRNEGDSTFRDISSEAGIVDDCCYGFQAVAFDYDEDGDLDVYVANDSTPNFLWRNDGHGRFEAAAVNAAVAFSDKGKEQGAMGVALGDANADGRVDIHVTNFSDDYHTIYRNDGGGFFSDVTSMAGTQAATYASLGWGCAWFDADADGLPELLAVNGHVYPQVEEAGLGSTYLQLNQLFTPERKNRYRDVTAEAGPGFAVPRSGRGAAIGDIDGDGDLDIAINNIDMGPTLLRNDGPQGHYLLVRLERTRGDRDAMGATVVAQIGDRRVAAVVQSQQSFLSAHDRRLHFGLGSSTIVDALEVSWPGGGRERWTGVAGDRELTLVEGQGEAMAEHGSAR